VSLVKAEKSVLVFSSLVNKDGMSNSLPLILWASQGTLHLPKRWRSGTYQNCLALSTDWKTVNLQSAGETAIEGSSGEVMGRAVAFNRLEKNELNVSQRGQVLSS
jgi:hypothetical protein